MNYKMKCDLCKKEFLESEIHESHNVPCYLFIYELGRNNRKNKADKFGRYWLCVECHKKYEELLNSKLIDLALKFSQEYFKEEKNGTR